MVDGAGRGGVARGGIAQVAGGLGAAGLCIQFNIDWLKVPMVSGLLVGP